MLDRAQASVSHTARDLVFSFVILKGVQFHPALGAITGLGAMLAHTQYKHRESPYYATHFAKGLLHIADLFLYQRTNIPYRSLWLPIRCGINAWLHPELAEQPQGEPIPAFVAKHLLFDAALLLFDAALLLALQRSTQSMGTAFAFISLARGVDPRLGAVQEIETIADHGTTSWLIGTSFATANLVDALAFVACCHGLRNLASLSFTQALWKLQQAAPIFAYYACRLRMQFLTVIPLDYESDESQPSGSPGARRRLAFSESPLATPVAAHPQSTPPPPPPPPPRGQGILTPAPIFRLRKPPVSLTPRSRVFDEAARDLNQVLFSPAKAAAGAIDGAVTLVAALTPSGLSEIIRALRPTRTKTGYKPSPLPIESSTAFLSLKRQQADGESSPT